MRAVESSTLEAERVDCNRESTRRWAATGSELCCVHEMRLDGKQKQTAVTLLGGMTGLAWDTCDAPEALEVSGQHVKDS